MGWDRHKLLWDGTGQINMSHGQPCESPMGAGRNVARGRQTFEFQFSDLHNLGTMQNILNIDVLNVYQVWRY